MSLLDEKQEDVVMTHATILVWCCAYLYLLTCVTSAEYVTADKMRGKQ